MAPMKTAFPDPTHGWATCFRHLPKVSRTFALAIDGLPEPLRGEVCVAYLLCRVLDTVEDAPGLLSAQRWDLMEPFLSQLKAPGSPLPRSWHEGVARLLPHRSSPHDLALLRDGDSLLAAYGACRPSARLVMARWVTEMGKGMVEFSARMGEGTGALKTLRSMADLDRYCYYIAGTVGYLLTDLFFLHSSHIGQARFYELQADAEKFGLGLQKVNIVKDLADDVRRGWCFIPTDFLDAESINPEAFKDPGQADAVYAAVRRVLADAADHLGCAWRYLTNVPLEEREIRLFLAYSLFFALRTLALVAANPGALVAPQKLKISRLEVAKIVARCQLHIGDPTALENDYQREAWELVIFRV
jgi:farnesyl-diphosphate farnesyltransferase